MKLGKKPARPDAVTFKFAAYANSAKLPKPPAHFGHETAIGPQDWQVLGNEDYGDCVFAGAAHETMLWNKVAGRAVSFTDQAVLSDYAALTGFNPSDPNSDQGTDMKDAASYRRKVGIVDSAGQRHKIAAYLSLKPGNLTQLYQALYLFGAVGVGIEFPASAMDQFNAGKPWSVVSRSPIDGGHYIPVFAKRAQLQCVTWGRLQGMTAGFLQRYCDEAIVYLTYEQLVAGKSPEGFDYAALQADLAAL